MVPEEDEKFRLGVCYIGEPAAHLSLAERSQVNLIEGAHHKYRNRTVDLLFASVAAHAKARGIGVVLRGSLSDGSQGLAAIHFAGGITMVWGSSGEAAAGMPRNATEYVGPRDFIGSIEAIADQIVRRVAAPRLFAPQARMRWLECFWSYPSMQKSVTRIGTFPPDEGARIMSSHYHAVIWIDHLETRIFQLGREDVHRLMLHPHNPTKHLHHRSHTIGSGHAAEDQDFLHRVVEAVAGVGAVLITGPSNEKTELVKHIHHHEPRLIDIVAGVETVDYPSDGALVAYAKRYFKTADHMTARIP